MQPGAQPVRGGTQIREQLLATHGRPQQSHVRNARLGEAAQVGEVGRQVMTHDDGGGEACEIERLAQGVGAGLDDMLRGREVCGDGVRRAMVDECDFPVEAGRKIHQRCCVRAGAEYQNPRRQRQRRDEQPPGLGVSFDPTDLPVAGALRQRGVHGRCLERRRCAAPRCTARQRQGSDRQIRARGLRHHADRGGGVRGERAGKMGEGLPVILRTSARPAARSRSNRGSSGPRDVSTCARLCQRGECAPCAKPTLLPAAPLRPRRAGALITRMVNKIAVAAHAPAEEAPPGPARRRRVRGRPKGASAGKVRERLLEAARELFLRYGYRAVSSRQIGAAAGVNFAMIRYYFGGKPGLYREILQGLVPPEIAALDAMQVGRGGANLADILSNITRVWAANPWIAGFVLREVLVPGGPMRTMFLREFPERLAPLVERAVRAEIERGALRSDLDPKLLVLSVVSLAVFPFLGFPLTSRVFGVRNDEEFVTRFLRHTQALLACGVAPGGRPA